MNTSIYIKSFFNLIRTKFISAGQTLSTLFGQLRNVLRLQPLPPTPPGARDEEHGVNTVSVPVLVPEHNPRSERIDWAVIVIGFCMESAVDVALQSVQSTNHDSNTELHALSMLVFFTFATLFVPKFMRPKFQASAEVSEGVGILLAASAFCYAVTIPIPYALKSVTWVTFAFCLFVAFVCKFCF